MVLSKEEICKRCELFEDTPELVAFLREEIAGGDYEHMQRYYFNEIICSLEGMYKLVRSFEAHLKPKDE